jgi:hypothetical protein
MKNNEIVKNDEVEKSIVEKSTIEQTQPINKDIQCEISPKSGYKQV